MFAAASHLIAMDGGNAENAWSNFRPAFAGQLSLE